MRFTASSYRYRRGYSAKNDGGLSYSGSKAQNWYKTTRMLLWLDFVANKPESPLDGISKNVPYKLVTIDLPSSPTGDMLTADLEIVTPLSLARGVENRSALLDATIRVCLRTRHSDSKAVPLKICSLAERGVTISRSAVNMSPVGDDGRSVGSSL